MGPDSTTVVKTVIPRGGLDARAQIREAEHKAAKRHKRVLIVFAVNWCYDCHVWIERFSAGRGFRARSLRRSLFLL